MDLGWIAQDVQRIAPELVESIDSLLPEGGLRGSSTSSDGHGDGVGYSDGPYLGVKYARAVVLIAEATKELADKADQDVKKKDLEMEAMQSKINLLEREVQALKSQLTRVLYALNNQQK